MNEVMDYGAMFEWEDKLGVDDPELDALVEARVACALQNYEEHYANLRYLGELLGVKPEEGQQ